MSETDLESLRKTWTALAESDPLWAVLSWPRKRGQRWNVTEFFATGDDEIDQVMEYIDSLGFRPPWTKALDFGCGVGRTTQALARHFQEVWGVDIAPAMIELAKGFNEHGRRCHYVLNEGPSLAGFRDESFRFVYSNIALQHIPPKYSRLYIKEFIRVLAPGGLAVFQAAARKRTRSSLGLLLRQPTRVARRLVTRWRNRALPKMEMHGLEVEEVLALIDRSGGKVVDVIPDEAAGPRWASFRYCASRVDERSARF